MTAQLSLFGSLIGDGDDPEPGRLGALLEGWLTVQVTGVLARMDIPDRLAAGPAGAEELAAAAGAAVEPLTRLLFAAQAYGLVRYRTDGRFELTPTGARLRSDAPGHARDLAVGFCWRFPQLWQAIEMLTETVRSGRPPAALDPDEALRHFTGHPEEASAFARAIRLGLTSVLLEELRRAGYRAPGSGPIVDVGGSTGVLLAGLLRDDPGRRGVLFDRAPVVAEAPAVLAEAGVADRTEVVAGSFFDGCPPGEVHLVCQVLHNWDDAHARKVLAACHAAGRPGSSLVVIEYILPSPAAPSLAHLFDVMMLMLGAGRERTAEHYRELAASAGYAFVRDLPVENRLPWHVLEFRRD